MSKRDRERWNEKYANRQPLTSCVQPDEWLLESLQLIEANIDKPAGKQRSLDIAAGLGHNAIWLAQQGWQSDAVDVSAKGLALGRQGAVANGVDVNWIDADLDDWRPSRATYDLMIVFRFLDRETVPEVVRAGLKPGGWLIYETFSNAQCERADSHISNPAFTLSPRELATLFADFEVISCRDTDLPDRSVQRYLGRRLARFR